MTVVNTQISIKQGLQRAIVLQLAKKSKKARAVKDSTEEFVVMPQG